MDLILKRFRDAAGKFPKYFAISMGLSLFLAILNAAIPWGIKEFLAKITDKNNYHTIVVGMIFFALFFGVRMLVNMAWYVSLDQFGGRYIEDLTISLEEALAKTYYDKIENMQPSIIRNIMYTDVLNVFRTIGHHIPSIIGSLAVVFVSLIVSFFFDINMTLFICVSIGIGLFLSWCSRAVLAKTAGQTNMVLKKHDQWCTQFVDMLQVIQNNPIYDYYAKRTSDNLNEFIRTSVKEDTRSVFWNGLVSGYNRLFSIALSAILAIPVAGNSISNLVFFTMIADLIMEHSQSVEQLFQQIVKTQISFENVEQVILLPEAGGRKTISHINEIKFNNVSFSYMESYKVLDDVCCTLKKGEIIRLEGDNGSGKSTFLKLLAGMYSPSSGSIVIDGNSILELDHESLKKKIMYINQEEKCLNETFRRYLETMIHRVIPDQVYDELIEFVDLPNDERIIKGNGSSLSVGQRKKLYAMRLFLQFDQADIIILDELTAGLDLNTKEKVYSRLLDMVNKQKKILILVDHTPLKLVPFTKVFHFEAGRLTIK